jgi:hypothetical protein
MGNALVLLVNITVEGCLVTAMYRVDLVHDISREWRSKAFDPDRIITIFRNSFPDLLEHPGDPMVDALKRYEGKPIPQEASSSPDMMRAVEMVRESTKNRIRRGIPAKAFSIPLGDGTELECICEQWVVRLECTRPIPRRVHDIVLLLLNSLGVGSIVMGHSEDGSIID